MKKTSSLTISFSVRNTIKYPKERSAFHERTCVHHDQRWAGSTASPVFHRATTPLIQHSACEYIDGVPLDWSGHGTSHVDYNKSDVLPFTQGKFLGHGMYGGMYETSCNGVKLAWKRKYCRRKIGERERREIQVIKKLSHVHIVRLMGTYTRGPFSDCCCVQSQLATSLTSLKTWIGWRSGTSQLAENFSSLQRTGWSRKRTEKQDFMHLES